MTFLDLYLPEIWVKAKSMHIETSFTVQWDGPDIQELPILQSFIEAHDMQEITIRSTSLGISRTYTKHFKGGGK